MHFLYTKEHISVDCVDNKVIEASIMHKKRPTKDRPNWEKFRLCPWSCSNPEKIELLVLSKSGTCGSIEWVDESKGVQILSDWALEEEEETSHNDLFIGMNEYTIKTRCIMEGRVAPQVVHVLPPIYEWLEVHLQKSILSDLICIRISLIVRRASRMKNIPKHLIWGEFSVHLVGVCCRQAESRLETSWAWCGSSWIRRHSGECPWWEKMSAEPALIQVSHAETRHSKGGSCSWGAEHLHCCRGRCCCCLGFAMSNLCNCPSLRYGDGCHLWRVPSDLFKGSVINEISDREK